MHGYYSNCLFSSLEQIDICNTNVTLSTVLTFLLTLILGVCIGGISVLGWKKHHQNKPKKSFSTPQKYDDVVAPGLLTEDNPAYIISSNQCIHCRIDDQNQAPVHNLSIKREASGSCPLYEDILQ